MSYQAAASQSCSFLLFDLVGSNAGQWCAKNASLRGMYIISEFQFTVFRAITCSGGSMNTFTAAVVTEILHSGKAHDHVEINRNDAGVS
jgi:hypothetical protein